MLVGDRDDEATGGCVLSLRGGMAEDRACGFELTGSWMPVAGC